MVRNSYFPQVLLVASHFLGIGGAQRRPEGRNFIQRQKLSRVRNTSSE